MGRTSVHTTDQLQAMLMYVNAAEDAGIRNGGLFGTISAIRCQEQRCKQTGSTRFGRS